MPTPTKSSSVARRERYSLCDLLIEVGPEAPTLCAGWTARDLAAHLVIRESRPDAGLGLVISALSGWTERVQAAAAQQPWTSLVSAVRAGPPRWSPAAIPAVDAAMNTVEYFVHHEDVRRGVADWQPRELDDSAVAELWNRVGPMSKLLTRLSPVGVVITPTDGPGLGQVRRLRSGPSDVTLAGPVGEIVLALFGRVTQGLEYLGTDADIAAFRSYPR